MNRCNNVLLPALVLFVLSPALRADVSVTTTLTLTNLQILPGSGTLDILSGFSTVAFTSVYDSLGGLGQQYDSEVDSLASASSATALASATGSASAPALTASASSGVNIPGALTASAGTNAGAAYGLLAGNFEIASAGGLSPVSVNVNAFLSASQILFTDQHGLDAKSEVVFNLFLYDPGGNLVSSLFLDNPLEIGPNSSVNVSSAPVLSSGALSLLTNSSYYLYASADAESFGLNTPEPSYYGALAMALLSLFMASRTNRRTKRQ